MGTLNFVFLFGSFESNVLFQKQSVGCGLVHKGRGFFFFEKAAFGEKRGSKIKMGMTFAISGDLLCASH